MGLGVFLDDFEERGFEETIIEAGLVIAGRNHALNHLVCLKHHSREVDVRCDTIVHGLSLDAELGVGLAIRRRPSMRAMSPPVLVPPMRSKCSQGRGVVLDFLRRAISSIRSRRMRSEERPRTPPPSRARIRAHEGAVLSLGEVEERYLASFCVRVNGLSRVGGVEGAGLWWMRTRKCSR